MLTKIAEDFTPRFEVVGPLVMLDVSGLSRLFGSPREIGEHMRRAGGPLRIALAPTQTAAALLALGRAGLTVVMPGDAREVLASLPVTLLGEFDRLRLAPGKADVARDFSPATSPATSSASVGPRRRELSHPPHVGAMEDVLPYFHSSLDRASDAARAAHACGGGWIHPRDSHAAERLRLQPPGPRGTPGTRYQAQCIAGIQALADILRKWGIKTCGALAALPAGEVYERLGARGVVWQRLSRGEDTTPLVPWVPEDPFEGSLDLEWPIEGLEPLSFVLGRLLETLAERLERADRGVAVLHTHLRLVSKQIHARTLQLPAPMRDPKTLRTLMLLDLESNPPAAAIDRVRVLIEPTPGRVTQWMLFERAQPSTEQVSTLLARLTALMGVTHVGSPRLLDSWKPGVFEMKKFEVSRAECQVPGAASGATCTAHRAPGAMPAHEAPGTWHAAPSSALRRFRLPVPARVQVHEGRPVRVMTDRRGVTGGAIVQAAGPWRISGDWWNDGTPRPSHLSCWDRDEWDVAIADGTVYRVFVERDVGQWFIEGVVD